MTAPTPRFEVGESLVVAAARQPGLDVTHATDYSFVDTVDATPGRPMSRERVADLVTTLAQDTHETYVQFEDAHDDRAFLRAQINMICRYRWYFNAIAVAFEREAIKCRQREPPQPPPLWTDAAIKALITQGVATALAEYEATKQ
ncbi:hypothetical protein Tco_0794711 [Tanacetum coccineum]